MGIRGFLKFLAGKRQIDQLLDEVDTKSNLIAKRMQYFFTLANKRQQLLQEKNYWAASFYAKTQLGLSAWIDSELEVVKNDIQSAHKIIDSWDVS